MPKSPKEKFETPVVSAKDTFSVAELQDLEAQARKEFEEEQKKLAADAFKEETKNKLKLKALHQEGKDAEGEELHSIRIDLAPHSPYIKIDGRVYYHGVSYKFTTAQAQTIKDVMHRTWLHESEIGGANTNAMYGRTPMNHQLSGE